MDTSVISTSNQMHKLWFSFIVCVVVAIMLYYSLRLFILFLFAIIFVPLFIKD
jgi:hypothetical protein